MLLVVSPTRGNSCILGVGRRHSGPAGCGSLARTMLVGGCVPDRKNEVVAPPLVAIREADAGARGVASRRWSRRVHHGCGGGCIARRLRCRCCCSHLEDVAGSRGPRAVVARGVGGEVVGVCVGGLVGWRSGQLGRGKSVVAPMNSVGVGRNFVEIVRTRNLRRNSFGCRPV